MARCLISFGANIGNPLETIQQAAELLRTQLQSAGDDFRLSRFYRTPPVGGPSGQPPFVNAVLAVDSPLSAVAVWQVIREVEHQLGRQRNRRWEARRIDLDILLYEQLRVWSPQLKIPHPRMCMRRFILVPAVEVAATWIDPVSGLSIRQLAASLQAGAGNVRVIAATSDAVLSMLREVAQLALAQLLLPGEPLPPTIASRWIALCPPAELQRPQANLPAAKLSMLLAESDPANAEIWERRHAELAESLGLSESPSSVPRLPLSGARYLLTADEPTWAIHEMVAALEAMDCPVEPIDAPSR